MSRVNRSPSVPAPGPADAPALAALDRALALVAADPHARGLADAASDDVVLDAPLAEWLYGAWWAGVDADAAAAAHSAGVEPLAGVLEAARREAAPVEEGWLVLASDGARIVAARLRSGGGEPTIVQRAADAVVASSRPGCPARPGDRVALLAGSGGPDADDAWWWAHTAEPVASEAVDRWYVHARPAGAPAIVAATVALGAGLGVALSLKCPTRAPGFARRDALVVYSPRRDRAALEGALAGWLAAVAPWVADGEPPLTRLVAPGIGFAEDPGGETSLGQLRCAQVAAAVVRVRRDGAADRRALLAAVGINPDRPELLVTDDLNGHRKEQP